MISLKHRDTNETILNYIQSARSQITTHKLNLTQNILIDAIDIDLLSYRRTDKDSTGVFQKIDDALNSNFFYSFCHFTASLHINEYLTTSI